jgi:uncharacterized protein YodC (DUF2158 family)
MSGDDSVAVTCAWFVKDALKSGSFPAKALNKSVGDVDEMSDEELVRIAQGSDHSENGSALTLGVGDTVLLRSGGPLMTIISIEGAPVGVKGTD